MSGWWFASSATSATRFTKSIAAAEVVEAELALERVVDLAPAFRHGHARRMARASRLARDLRSTRGRGPSHAARLAQAARRAVRAPVRARLPAAGAPRRARRCCRCACRRPPSCSPRRRPASRPRVELAARAMVAAALLLQLKTVLDNADGQLARAAGKESRARALPRLGVRPARERGAVRGARARDGQAVARARLVPRAHARARASTSTSSACTAASAASRARRGPRRRGSRPCSARIYDVVYAPQDRLVERLRRVAPAPARRGPAARLAYHDRATLAVLANFGLSTQLAVLGVCLAARAPEAYLWIAIGCGVALVPLRAAA